MKHCNESYVLSTKNSSVVLTPLLFFLCLDLIPLIPSSAANNMLEAHEVLKEGTESAMSTELARAAVMSGLGSLVEAMVAL